jgi:hypothetical protein
MKKTFVVLGNMQLAVSRSSFLHELSCTQAWHLGSCYRMFCSPPQRTVVKLLID